MIEEYTVTDTRYNSHMGMEYHDKNRIFLIGHVDAKKGDKIKVLRHPQTSYYIKIWVNGEVKFFDENPFIPDYITKEKYYSLIADLI